MKLPGLKMRTFDEITVDTSEENNAPVQLTRTPVVKLHSVVWYGPNSQPVTCPYCLTNIKTSVSSKVSSTTHTWACYLLHCCLCCIPYCCATCQNRLHHCPNCKAFLGVYHN